MTASASATDGSTGLSSGFCRMSCVNRRALLAFASFTPALSDRLLPHSEAMFGQSRLGLLIPTSSEALRTLWMYESLSSVSSQWALRVPPLLVTVYSVEQFGVRVTLSEHNTYALPSVGPPFPRR